MSGVILFYLFSQFYGYADCSCNLLQGNCSTVSLHLAEYMTWDIKSGPQDLTQANFSYQINVAENAKKLDF